MVDKDPGDREGPSLEIPSLGSMFRGRKTKKSPRQDDSPTPSDVSADVVEPETDEEPTVAIDDTGPGGLPAADLTGDLTGAPVAVPGGVHTTVREATPQQEPDEPEGLPRQFALPAVSGRVAASITGLAIGGLAVALTYLAIRGCEAVQGTSSCGTPGFFLLTAIMILLVVLGSALLGAWRVADPGSTSFLAVGLLVVIALLFLIQVIFSPWMVVVIPLVALGTFVLSQWLTSLFIDETVAPE